MEKILRNCLKVLLVMVISISALNLGLVSALEENEEEAVVNYDDQVSGIALSSYASYTGVLYVTFVDNTTGAPLNTIDATSMIYSGSSLTVAQANLMTPGYTVSGISSVMATYGYSSTSSPAGARGVYSSSYWGSIASNVWTFPTGLNSVATSDIHYYLRVTSNYASVGTLAANSYDVSLRNVTGGSLSSTVSKASAGSTVTVTASPSTGYSLSSATVSGATNVSLNFFKI